MKPPRDREQCPRCRSFDVESGKAYEIDPRKRICRACGHLWLVDEAPRRMQTGRVLA